MSGSPVAAAALPDARRSALRLVLGANAVFLVVEVVGGLAFRSLALLADAAHMASDVAALTIALAAEALARRPPSTRHTYGLGRAEVLGAQANGLLLAGAAVWIAVEAVRRLDEPPDVVGPGLLAVAGAGLVVNVVGAWWLARVAGTSLNLRAAYWHLVSDAVGSVGAIAAGVAVVAFDAPRADVFVSFAVAALVVNGAWRLLRDTTRVLLEATPAGLDVEEVTSAMGRQPRVEAVHHVHVWSLGSEQPALSAHLVLGGDPTLARAQDVAAAVKVMLGERFGIAHATLEVEGRPCEPRPGRPPTEGRDAPSAAGDAPWDWS